MYGRLQGLHHPHAGHAHTAHATHTAHTAHAAHAAHAGITSGGFGFRNFGHQGFGSQHHTSDGGSILQARTHHLGRVDNARLDQILQFPGDGIVASGATLGLDLLNDNGTFLTGIDGDLAQGSFELLLPA